jgi:oligosaccharyltransferase complex subunit beta
MRVLPSLWLLALSLLHVVLAKSAVGDRLLVVLEDESQKGLYSKFWADLEGMFGRHFVAAVGSHANNICVLARDFKLTFQSPRDESLSLFRHRQLAYDHLLLTPPKSKGEANSRPHGAQC